MTPALKLRQFLADHTLSAGMGTADSPCSIGAINLVLSNKLTDERPECMHPILHAFVIHIQDVMPDSLRNSSRYKDAIPRLLNTANSTLDHKRILLDWLFTKVLPIVPHIGTPFETEWLHMLEVRTHEAADKAAKAADKARIFGTADPDTSANVDASDAAADAAAYAAYVAAIQRRRNTSVVANGPIYAAYANAADFDHPVYAADAAARAITTSAAAANDPDFWDKIDVPHLIEELTQ